MALNPRKAARARTALMMLHDDPEVIEAFPADRSTWDRKTLQAWLCMKAIAGTVARRGQQVEDLMPDTSLNLPIGEVTLASKPFDIVTVSRRTGKETTRRAVIVNVGNHGNFAFYQSSGRNGVSSEGEWVPFNGISRFQGGWFVKTSGKVPSVGPLRVAHLWLNDKPRVKGKPQRVFHQNDYPVPDPNGNPMEQDYAFYRAVNNHIAKYDALREPNRANKFQHQTSNVGQ